MNTRLLGLCALLVASPLAAQSVPTGFTNETIVTGITQPVGMGFAPDGRFFVTGQASGQLWVCTTSGAKALVGTVPGVTTGSERGLLGVAVDPQWPTNPYVYLCFSYSSGNMRIARYTLTGDVGVPTSTNLSLGALYWIVTNVPDGAFNHNGGTVRFGPDGMLYAGFGDDASSCSAQNTTDGRGMILRMDVSGLPAGAGGPPSVASITPPGNPFPGTTNLGPLCWAYGLRNPFRFTIDQATGYLYIADVGQNAWEEWDECTAGGQNFGWPIFEGNAGYTSCSGATGPYLPPMIAMSQSTGARSSVSMPRYRNQAGGAFNYGASYEGNVFYTDYFRGSIRRLTWSGSSWITPPAVPGQPNGSDWGTGFVAICDCVQGPDGAIYYVKQSATYGSGPGIVGRIKSDANAPQLAIVSGDGQVGNASQALLQPLRVSLMTPGGLPMPGIPVTFSVASGDSVVSPVVVNTDLSGEAATTLTLGTLPINPSVTASAASATPATFNATWRGILVSYYPASNLLIAQVRHSQTNSPFTLAIDLPVAVPYAQTPYGPIWTSIFNPGPGFFAFDGLGLLGPPDPLYKTLPSTPIWSQVFSGLPPTGGLTLTFQAYALDTALLPGAAAFMISQKVDITLN